MGGLEKMDLDILWDNWNIFGFGMILFNWTNNTTVRKRLMTSVYNLHGPCLELGEVVTCSHTHTHAYTKIAN